MNLKYNDKLSIYGCDNYFSYGLAAVLNAEVEGGENTVYQHGESPFTIWILNNLNLADVIAFTEKQNYLPRLILCSAKYIRILSRLPLFMHVTLVDSKSSVEHIKSVFSLLLKKQDHSLGHIEAPSILYTSLKQKDVAMLFLKGFSPVCCSNMLKLSVKMVSHYKRSLMKDLDLRSDQEFITVLKINERFLEYNCHT